MAGGGEKNRLQFFLDLIDKVSKPASRVADSLKGVEKSLGAVAKVDKATGGSRFKFIESITKGAKAAYPAVQTLASGIGTLLKFSAGASVAVLGIAAVGVRYGLEAAEFKKRTLAGLEILEGGFSAAEETLQQIQDASNTFGIDTDKLAGMYKELRGVGFAAKETFKVLAAGQDIGAIFGDDAGAALTEALKKLKAGDSKLDAKELTPLFKKANVPLAELYKTLAQAKGQTVAQVEAMMKAGQIKADDGVGAILATVQRLADKGGPLGSAAKDIQGGSLAGQFQSLKNRIGDLFEDVNGGPFINVLKSVNELLSGDSESAKALRSTLMNVFERIGAVVQSALNPGTLKSFIDGVTTLVDVGYDLAEAFGGGVFSGFMAVMKPVIDVFRDASSSGISWTEVMRNLGYVVGAVLAILAIGIGTVVTVIGWMIENWQILAVTLFAPLAVFAAVGAVIYFVIDAILAFVATAIDAVTHAENLGSGIVDGIWAGIKAAWGSLKSNWNKLVDTLPASVASTLKISSPSKVMEQLGIYTVQGYTRGVSTEAANSNAALTQAVAPPAVQPIANSNGGGRAISINMGNIVVNAPPGTTDPDAFGRAAARSFKEELADVLEELAQASGA